MVSPVLPSFEWGADGKARTPAQVQRQRDIAAALMSAAPQGAGWAGALSQAASGLSSKVLDEQANVYETRGTDAAKNLFSGLGSGASTDSIAAALMDPSAAWATPGQAGVAEALLNNNLRQDDPGYQLDLQLKQAQLNAANAPQGIDPTASMQNYQFLISQGATPEQAQSMAFGGSGPVINVNNGDTNDFYKALDAAAGQQVPLAIDAARVAESNNIRLQQLETLVGTNGTAPQGVQGAFVQAASQFGIPVEGADDLQAAQALISQMVPGQRPPGSGTMSDQDLALFKASLPAIINQPGGNQKIIETTKAVNQYVIEQGRIASMLANREITREQATAMQAAVPNPLQGIASAGTAQPGAQTMPMPSPDGWQDMGNGVRIRPIGQ